MQRRTITVPDDLDAQIAALVARGAVPSASRFFQDAARAHLAALGGKPTMAPPFGGRAPWQRLRVRGGE